MISGEGTHFKLIRCDDSEGWLRQRKRGVGGSDVAAGNVRSHRASHDSADCAAGNGRSHRAADSRSD